MSALEALAKSETTLSKRIFAKTFVYRDDHHENETTLTLCNTDFQFHGESLDAGRKTRL
jgi:hypothetical protein